MATINVYITGHGKWSPDFSGHGDAGLPGFTTVPKGCKVIFYIHNAKTMVPSDVRSILEGRYTGNPESEIGEFKFVPNMKISPVTAAERAEDYSYFVIGQNNLPVNSIFYSPTTRTTLAELMERVRTGQGLAHQYVFHWLCCRALDLKGTVAGNEGVNARELLDSQEYQLIDRTGGGKRFIRKVRIESRL